MAKDTKRTEIGQRLYELRTNHPTLKTQESVAEAMGIKRDNLARYETNVEPRISAIKKLCELFNVSSDYLIFGKESYVSALNEKLSNKYMIGQDINYNNSNNNLKTYVLNEDEQEIIDHIRSLSDEEQGAIMTLIRKRK